MANGDIPKGTRQYYEDQLNKQIQYDDRTEEIIAVITENDGGKNQVKKSLHYEKGKIVNTQFPWAPFEW